MTHLGRIRGVTHVPKPGAHDVVGHSRAWCSFPNVPECAYFAWSLLTPPEARIKVRNAAVSHPRSHRGWR
jgi:hypothetical protein